MTGSGRVIPHITVYETNRLTDRWTHRLTGRRTDEPTDRGTDWRTDGQTNGRTDERTDRRIDGPTVCLSVCQLASWLNSYIGNDSFTLHEHCLLAPTIKATHPLRTVMLVPYYINGGTKELNN